MRFVIPDSLLALLHAAQAQVEVEGEIEAFLMFPGLGPAYYLTADGRVLVDASDWDGSPIGEASDEDAISAIAAGVRVAGVRELLELLPVAPPGASPCASCGGERYNPSGFVCNECGGRGWTLPPSVTMIAPCESVRSYASQLGSDVKQMANSEGDVISLRRGLPFARTGYRPYPERVFAFARVDPSSVKPVEGFSRDVSRGEWMLVPFDDRTRDLEPTLRWADDLERAKPILRRAYCPDSRSHRIHAAFRL
jgi:hypothetical protein